MPACSFLRGKPGAPFAIIALGGGFAYVASVHEGFPYTIVTDWSRQMPSHSTRYQPYTVGRPEDWPRSRPVTRQG